MFVLGLTGSIAMGKTWSAKCFRHFGVPVCDADACVHELLAPGGAAVETVAATFPGVVTPKGGIDRCKLGDRVFGDDQALDTLEAILHPLVHRQQRAFLAVHARRGVPVVVLDVPLLFEAGGRSRVDAVAVVSAPAFVQRQRALSRAGMTVHKLEAILARQMPDTIKRRLADFVIATGGPRGQSLRQIGEVVKVVRQLPGRVWGPHWGFDESTRNQRNGDHHARNRP